MPPCDQGSEDQVDPTPASNILLVGFMATGKSSVGREVARMLKFDFVDTDEMIECSAGETIPDLFAERGEEHFRDLEAEALRSVQGGRELVVSTGGGIILRKENRHLLRELGFTVWLQASHEELLSRLARSHDRPLMQTSDPASKVEEMLAHRDPLYAEVSELVIDSTDLAVADVAYGIVESARVFFG